MKNLNFFSISEFSGICGISRKALIFYDRIGLFSPAWTDENGYRYYSHRQISLITVINTLTELGMPLREIRENIGGLTPWKCRDLLERQRGILRHKLEHLKALQDMVGMRLEQLERGIAGINAGGPEMRIIEQPDAQPLFRSEPIRYPKTDIPDKVMVDFYNQCEQCGIPFGYSVGYLVRHDDVTGRNRNIASRIWFRLRNAKHANAFMPPGKYAVAYASGDYGRTDYIYSSLLRFIEKNGCSVTGDSYEEYLLDEMTTADPEKYLLQIAVRVGCPE